MAGKKNSKNQMRLVLAVAATIAAAGLFFPGYAVAEAGWVNGYWTVDEVVVTAPKAAPVAAVVQGPEPLSVAPVERLDVRPVTNVDNLKGAPSVDLADASEIDSIPQNSADDFGPGDPGYQCSGTGCPGAATAAAELCETAAAGATSMCNTASFLGIDDPVAGAAMEVAAGQLVSMLANQGKTQAAICKNQKNVNKLVAALSAGKAAACAFKISKCTASCSGKAAAAAGVVPSVAADMAASLAACHKLNWNVVASTAQAVMSGYNVASAGKCQDMASVAPTPAPTPPGYQPPPNPTPFQLNNTADCSDPMQQQMNMVCVCRANPRAPGCNGQVPGLNAANGGTRSGGPASPSAPFTGPDAGDGYENVQKIDAKPITGQSEAGGGNGGGFAAGGNGSSGAGGGTGEDYGRMPSDKSIIGGVSAAAGGSGSNGGPGLTNDGAGGGGGRGSRAGGGGDDDGKGAFKFNLAKYLPNGQGGRGPSSMTVPNTDGITCAMCDSLFTKVSGQYKLQAPGLMQGPNK